MAGREVRERLACGHEVEVAPGVRVFNFYDVGFGVVTRVGEDSPLEGRWHNVRSEGAEYWPEGRVSLLNGERLACVPCGQRAQARRERSW